MDFVILKAVLNVHGEIIVLQILGLVIIGIISMQKTIVVSVWWQYSQIEDWLVLMN